jgi:hypothetical protein
MKKDWLKIKIFSLRKKKSNLKKFIQKAGTRVSVDLYLVVEYLQMMRGVVMKCERW